jgi:hypothetical protein
MARRLCALACALYFMLRCTIVHAADVGIVAREGHDSFVARLILELSQLSLSAARVASLDVSRDTAVLVVGDDLELVDMKTRESRKLLAGKTDALKVAEEVHALMLPLVARPAEPEPPAAPAPPPVPERRPKAPAPAAPQSAPARRTFEASGSAGAMFGASTPGLVVGASLAWMPLRSGSLSAGIAASALFAALAENVARSQGSADIQPLIFGPELLVRWDLAPAIAVDAGASGFAAFVAFRGDATAPLEAQRDDAWTFAPGARVRGQTKLGDVGVFVEGRAGVALPAIAVRFAGESVHQWGRPWSTVGGGVSYAF